MVKGQKAERIILDDVSWIHEAVREVTHSLTMDLIDEYDNQMRKATGIPIAVCKPTDLDELKSLAGKAVRDFEFKKLGAPLGKLKLDRETGSAPDPATFSFLSDERG